MHMLSLTSLIEEAAFAAPGIRRDRGNVASLDRLLEPSSIAKLEERYPAFAFLAFDPAADKAIVEYIASGTTANDSGPNILTLVFTPRPVRVPVRVRAESFDAVSIQEADLEATRLLGELFAGTAVPALPGVALFKSLSERSEAVYFPLSGLSTEEVRTRLRNIYSIAGGLLDESRDDSRAFAERLALQAQKKNYQLACSGPISTRRWLINVFRYLEKHVGDLVALIGLLK